MMIIKLILLFILPAMTNLTLRAEPDDIKNEISAMQNDQIIIINSRDLIYQSLKNKNYTKAIKILSFLSNRYSDKGIQYLHNYEKWVINYFVQKHNPFLSFLSKKTNINIYYEFGYSYYRFNDGMEAGLPAFFTNSKDELKKKIRISPYADQEKELLVIGLNLLSDGLSRQNNRTIDQYKNKYPSAPYDYFLEKNLKMKYSAIKDYKRRDWGVGWIFGGGYALFTAPLSEAIGNNGSLNLSLDIYYLKFGLFYSICIMPAAGIKKDFSYQGKNFTRETSASAIAHNLGSGYFLIDNQYFRLAPVAGLSTFYIRTFINKSEWYSSIYYKLCFFYGINADLKLFSIKRQRKPPACIDFTPSIRYEELNGAIRFNLFHNIPFSNNDKPDFLRGSNFGFSIGFLLHGGDLIPDF